MSADDEPPKSSTSESAQVEAHATSQSDTPTPPQDPTPNTDDRSALLTQARAFLASPQIQHQDDLAKRKFLMEKGLNPDEVDTLMHEFIPPVPPRYYPQPAPSNLPNLLLGLARLAAWLMGSSAFLFVIFSRLILPRLTQTSNARRSLQLHHLGLLERLNTSIKSLKATQNEAFSVLPKPTRPTEDPKYEDFHSLDELQLSADVPLEVPEYTLLRCAIEGLAAQEKKVETEELFEVLQQRYPWLKTDEGLQYRNSLWETLTTNPSFPLIDDGGHLVWTYQPPIIPLPQPSNDPLLSSLTSLKYALPPPRQLYGLHHDADVQPHIVVVPVAWHGVVACVESAGGGYSEGHSSIERAGAKPTVVRDESAPRGESVRHEQRTVIEQPCCHFVITTLRSRYNHEFNLTNS